MLAKISAPQPSRVLARPRLFRRLDRGRRTGLLWVVGPPGAGKTTLVASWLAARGGQHAWMQLDSGDGDVATFFHFLAQALQAGRGTPRLPPFTPESLAAPGDFARRLFRALAAARRPPSTIVLDDWHELPPDSPVHGALRDGIAELPPSLALVVVSREPPPPAMARWRARGRLHVLAGDELSLTAREAAGIARLREPRLASDTIAALHARAEGWAAGLVLLLSGGDVAARSAQPARDTFVFDYFADEVFARAEPEVRRVLLETALLPRVDAETAASLTGVARAGDLLEALARSGHFVSRHEGPPPTYELHALFREFLQRRAETVLSPERRATLHRGAAELLASAGAHEDAVALLLGAGAWSEATRAIGAIAPRLLADGRAGPLAGWILQIPEAIRAREPTLLLWLGAARAAREPAVARGLLERAHALLGAAGDVAGACLAWSLLVEGFLFELDDLAPLDRWIPELERLRGALPARLDPSLAARLAAVAFGALMNRQPWRPELREFEEQTLAIALGPGPPGVRLAAGRGLSLYYGWWGMDLTRARLLVESLAPVAERGDAPSAIFWTLARANVELGAARLDACAREVDRGLARAAESGVHAWDPFLLSFRVWIALARGELRGAAATLPHVLRGDGSDSRLARCMFHSLSCMVARAAGDAEVAREHGRLAIACARAAGLVLADAASVATAALAAPEGEREVALREALALARRCRYPNAELGCLLGLALLHLRDRDEASLRPALAEAFALARRLGMRSFVWLTRDELATCCAAALERGIEPGVVGEVVRALGLTPPAAAVSTEAWPWELRIEALGELTIVRGGQRLVPGRKAQKKPMDMLRLLVARGPSGAGQEALAETLWPDSDGDAARSALKTTVYRLRRLLGRPDAVVQRDGRIALDGRVVFVDAWAPGTPGRAPRRPS